jgi:hypothetical protein
MFLQQELVPQPKVFGLLGVLARFFIALVGKELEVGLTLEQTALLLQKCKPLYAVLLVALELGVTGLEARVVSLEPEPVKEQTAAHTQKHRLGVKLKAAPLVAPGRQKDQSEEPAQRQR